MTALAGDVFPGAWDWSLLRTFEPGWYPGNTSIAHSPDGWAAIVTCRDLYRHDNGSTWDFADDTGAIRTRNLFVELDDRLAAVHVRELPGPNLDIKFAAVRGVEDPRLYWRDGRWWYSGSICEHHESGEPRTAICDLGGLVEILDDVPAGTWVKNLMPTGTDTPRFVDVMASAPDLHGGAVMPWSDGWLGVVHDIVWPGRVYRHRFARFDLDGRVVTVTDPFTFGHANIEFAAGITAHNDNIVVSFGVLDRDSRLASIPAHLVRRALGWEA